MTANVNFFCVQTFFAYKLQHWTIVSNVNDGRSLLTMNEKPYQDSMTRSRGTTGACCWARHHRATFVTATAEALSETCSSSCLVWRIR